MVSIFFIDHVKKKKLIIILFYVITCKRKSYPLKEKRTEKILSKLV